MFARCVRPFALRVFPAETRLTVYRRRQYCAGVNLKWLGAATINRVDNAPFWIQDVVAVILQLAIASEVNHVLNMIVTKFQLLSRSQLLKN